MTYTAYSIFCREDGQLSVSQADRRGKGKVVCTPLLQTEADALVSIVGLGTGKYQLNDLNREGLIAVSRTLCELRDAHRAGDIHEADLVLARARGTVR